ncbi:glycogenin-1 isoform X2 [Plutella xylostella]|uniref:glycogenin-1 isoform X2 n=1 Tax=Plutella xylostella TaxID=51655 RepID=UPI0020322F52|nr:glycogenin-1 isoform X2 [Plutella xylostella]XP_048489336.1 glycogenin-1 isoform X2 [Plutella xylostella]
MSNRSWVTLATNDSYALGALVLAHSLQRAGSVYSAVVLITPSVTDAMRERLRAVFADVIIVDVLDSRDAAHLALLQRPELGITFTKIHCWGLTQFEKCVFLDADALVVQNCDELFEREELSAAPDVGWPDCFNSGVFVFTPSKDTFDALIKFAKERGSFDGGDQGLLNSFFSDWAHGDIKKHLPFLYNVTSAAFYSYLPALKHFGQNLKIIHFIGAAKPWLQTYNWESHTVDAPGHLQQFLQLWWTIFVTSVHPQLDVAMEEAEVWTDPPPPPHTHYYVPEVNPYSEFPWHHMNYDESQQEKEQNQTDFSEYIDPWKLYEGNQTLTQDLKTEEERVIFMEELRDYASEFAPQQQYLESSHSHNSHNFPTPHQHHEHHHHDAHYEHHHSHHQPDYSDNTSEQSHRSNQNQHHQHQQSHQSYYDDHSWPYNKQTGVAGTLARVVVGSAATQRDALDELTRRQGWEAGNIDYMGADSFDNIWAKISQTLNQAPKAKEPSPPPKAPSPLKENTPIAAPSPAVKQPSPPKEPAPVAAPAPVVATAPVEVPAPVAAPEPVPAPAQVEVPAVVAAPATVDAPAPVVAPAPVAAATPVEVPASVEVPAPVAAPVEVPPPSAVEASATGTEVASLIDPASLPATVSDLVKAAPTKNAEPPVVPPTPPVTPKSTPEASTTPVSEVPPVVTATTPVLTATEPTVPVVAPATPATPLQEVVPELAAASAASPKVAGEATPVQSTEGNLTPLKTLDLSGSTDSPPLANTPSKEEPSDAAKTTEEAAQETRL